MARKPSGPPPKSKRPASTSIKSVAVQAPVVAVPAGRVASPDAPRPSFNLIRMLAGFPRFVLEVRAEARKITWTSWRETWITSMMVFMMVAITAVFFLVVDQIMSHGMQLLLKLAA